MWTKQCDQWTQTDLVVMVYEDEVRDVSVQTCCTSPRMNIPDIQEIAMVAYGKNVPRAPPARLFSSSGHVLGITCWDCESEAFSRAWSVWLEIKRLHPDCALAVLASASRLLGAVEPLCQQFPETVVYVAVILLSTTEWELEWEYISPSERNEYLMNMNLHGRDALVQEATCACIVELGK